MSFMDIRVKLSGISKIFLLNSDLFLCTYSKSKSWLLLLEYGYFYKLSAPVLSGNTAVSICFASLLLVRTQRRRDRALSRIDYK